jgi:hypothetical protein
LYLTEGWRIHAFRHDGDEPERAIGGVAGLPQYVMGMEEHVQGGIRAKTINSNAGMEKNPSTTPLSTDREEFMECVLSKFGLVFSPPQCPGLRYCSPFEIPPLSCSLILKTP